MGLSEEDEAFVRTFDPDMQELADSHLTEYRDRPVPLSAADYIKTAAEKGNEVKSLCVSRLTKKIVGVLYHTLVSPNCKITSLVIERVEVGSRGIQAIINAISKTGIMSLELNVMRMSDADISSLCAHISNGQLTSLSLWGANINKEVALALVESIKSPDSVLTTLDLGWCAKVSDDVAGLINDALKGNKAKLDEEFDAHDSMLDPGYYDCVLAMRLVRSHYGVSNEAIQELSDATRGTCFFDPKDFVNCYFLLFEAMSVNAGKEDFDALRDFVHENKEFGEYILVHLVAEGKFTEADKILDMISNLNLSTSVVSLFHLDIFSDERDNDSFQTLLTKMLNGLKEFDLRRVVRSLAEDKIVLNKVGFAALESLNEGGLEATIMGYNKQILDLWSRAVYAATFGLTGDDSVYSDGCVVELE